MKKIVVCLLLLTGIGLATSPSDVKVQHIGSRLVAVSCRDGADPTVNPTLTREIGTLVVSCGKI